MAKQAEAATLDDLPSLVEVAFSAFNSPYSLSIFPDSPGGREYMRQYYEMSIKSEPGRQQSKVFVVRDDNGMAKCECPFELVSSQYRRQGDFRCHILHHSPRRRGPLAMAQEGSQPAARHDREQNGWLLQSNDRATMGRNEG